jgi:hypothetical protein
MITPREFVEQWAQSELREQQASHSHFNELCQLVGYKTPTQMDPEGTFFTFEERVEKATGGKGRADVWYKGRFAWEYKGKHKDLDAAYSQLLAYRAGLGNPPLLVVCDFLEYRIYPQWPNASAQPFVFRNADLLRPDTLRYITWLLESPEKFLELRAEELQRREKITLDLAYKFAHLADLMRQHTDDDGEPVWESMQIARFLTKLVFIFFVEDIGLIPKIEDNSKNGLFRFMLNNATWAPRGFVSTLRDLFRAMEGDVESVLLRPVPYFNGNLFTESSPGADDGMEVLDVTQIPGAIMLLREVSTANWRDVNPTIFGTLFEGALDEGKRAQLGAHYTGEDDIRLVVEPVLMQPLYDLWQEIQAEATPLLQIFLTTKAPKTRYQAEVQLINLHNRMMNRLENTRVLDPACGSGNFLYVSLRALKDLEVQVHRFFEPLSLRFRDVVTPRQLYGIEKDEFAAKLAHVVVWIGYLQWRYEDEGVLHPVMLGHPQYYPHPHDLPNPIIQDKNTADEPDRIICADAIMRYDAEGRPYEPEWPEVDMIMGNPPFFGDRYMRSGRPELGQSGLGDSYVDDLRQLYKDRLPSCDLVCYWYEKARASIQQNKAKRAGLLATNSIRGGANRTVLERVKETGDIFMAWGDRDWVLEGASVRISVIAFDDGSQKEYLLDGAPVDHINADLQNTIDATKARRLTENLNLVFMGVTPAGPFDLEGADARMMLVAHNVSGALNADVVRPYYNALDIARGPRDVWTIDFGIEMSEADASQYELPFEYVKEHVLPIRSMNNRKAYREKWWLYAETRPAMREAIKPLRRYLATPMVSKYRIFVWLEASIVPANLINVIPREDDYFFGVLHSYPHEVWSLRLGTSLENRPRYTPSTTFETFAFPWSPRKEDKNSAAYQAISAAAQQLHAERDVWLNPPTEMIEGPAAEKILRDRTLTNLYNALEDFRQKLQPLPINGEGRKTKGHEFAPRLAALHDALDQAVLAAYDWSDLTGRLRTIDGDEELLRRLLALNLERAPG